MADHDDRIRLEQAELFAPGLIHEMRHPLMGIKAGLQLISRQLGEAVTQHEEWQLVAGQLARLEELFRSYQDFLDPENRLPTKFSVGPIVQQAISLVQYRLKRLGERFRIDLGGGPIYVWGTPNALLHAATNLLLNAADAVEEFPSARVTLRLLATPGDGAQVRISDEGHGISPEVKARIFSPRFTTKPRGKGTGLGLHIARRVISSFGGTVALVDESDPRRLPGARTEFCIVLPAPPSAADADPVPQFNPAGAAAIAEADVVEVPALHERDPARYFELALAEFRQSTDLGQRVLVVDDDPGVLAVFAQLLPSLGVQFELAESAEVALYRFERGNLQLAIVDKNLPGDSGIDLLRQLSEIDPLVEVMVITAYPSVESLLEVFRLGASDYLEKPLADLDLVSTRIRSAVRRQKLRARTHRLASRLETVKREALAAVPETQRAQLEQLYELIALPVARGRMISFGGAAAATATAAALRGMEGTELLEAQSLAELSAALERSSVDLVMVDPARCPAGLERVAALVRERLGAQALLALSESSTRQGLLDAFTAGAVDFIPLDRLASGPLIQQRVRAAVRRSREHQREREVIRLLLDIDIDNEPLGAPAPTPAPARSAPPPRASGPFAGKVLLVDDEEIIVTVLRKSLAAAGYQVTCAADGNAALEAISSGTFDAVITDKNLPGTSGVDVAKAARRKYSHAAIVVITGYASRESAAQLLRVGIDEYVSKPFELDYLVDRLPAMIARRSALARSRPPRPVERVLVVEPDARDRARLSMVIGGLGYAPLPRHELAVPPGEPAPDAVVVVHEALSREAKASLAAMQAEHPHLKTVVISSCEGVDEMIDAILVGARAHLVRPWSDSQLISALQEAFAA